MSHQNMSAAALNTIRGRRTIIALKNMVKRIVLSNVLQGKTFLMLQICKVMRRMKHRGSLTDRQSRQIDSSGYDEELSLDVFLVTIKCVNFRMLWFSSYFMETHLIDIICQVLSCFGLSKLYFVSR